MLKKVTQRGRRRSQHQRRPIFRPPNPEPAKTGSFPWYVEDGGEPRTKLGKGRVLARLGRRVELRPFSASL